MNESTQNMPTVTTSDMSSEEKQIAPGTVVLDEPIKRDKYEIKEVSVRKPQSGELRGLNLIDLANLNVIALHKVLPRITTPTLTEQEVQKMDPADLLSLGVEVAAFLAKKADLALLSPSE